MNEAIRESFLEYWAHFFPGADLPFAIFYSDDGKYESDVRSRDGFGCMIGQFNLVLKGERVAFTAGSIGCQGGVRYSGFPVKPSPDLGTFLSCGVPGKVEGLRLKKNSQLVEASFVDYEIPAALGKYLVATRIDNLKADECPEVVAWLAPPDVLTALFHLVGFSRADRFCVISPQASGCGALVSFPLAERGKEEPRAVIGMFDISARPYVKKGVLSFAVPVDLFAAMAGDMGESFLITDSWEKVKQRL
ncbi:MAG: DUF169 domain-containing protein [bacterium]|nr:DUF169 domain-containing protein [bacterium]MDT8395603.1 DUF169 domain-containing protein [bacterium]